MELFLIAVAFLAGGLLVWKLHDTIQTDLAAVEARVASVEAKVKAPFVKA